MSLFASALFAEGLFASHLFQEPDAEVATKSGGGGIERIIFKPTGLIDRKKEQKIEEPQLDPEVAALAELARKLASEIAQLPEVKVPTTPVPLSEIFVKVDSAAAKGKVPYGLLSGILHPEGKESDKWL